MNKTGADGSWNRDSHRARTAANRRNRKTASRATPPVSLLRPWNSPRRFPRRNFNFISMSSHWPGSWSGNSRRTLGSEHPGDSAKWPFWHALADLARGCRKPRLGGSRALRRRPAAATSNRAGRYQAARNGRRWADLAGCRHQIALSPSMSCSVSRKMACLIGPVMRGIMRHPGIWFRAAAAGASRAGAGILTSSLRQPTGKSRPSCQRAGHGAGPRP